MSQLSEPSTYSRRPLPDGAAVTRDQPRRPASAILRSLGAVAVLVVGAVHLQQDLADHFDVVPIIGPLFVLNFAGATVIGLGLLVPTARLQLVHLLLAVGGIGLAATSFVFLFVSEHRQLFGFHDYGYRTAIVVALAAEAAAVVALAAYVVTAVRRKT
jgi:hypothetical protein